MAHGDIQNNKRHHVYMCEKCGKHVDVWVDIQIPDLVYCDPCAFKIMDVLLDKEKRNCN